jgi:hypothetical protein
MADIFKPLGEIAKLIRTGSGAIHAQNEEIKALLSQLVILNGGPITTTSTTTTTTTAP